ncbi:MAG: cyclic nucleotide-binding domain-containing protein, partial [Rhodospirillaceae bacterium]|nr:cyclic nucleotide-binding domain-containing protein [Rhodospirillaceae bacterium]
MNEKVTDNGNGSARTLKKVELLTEAPPEIVADLEKKCRWLNFEENQIIVDRDDESTDVYFIISGKVKVMDFLADDQEIALAELGPGASFGELSAMDKSKRSARVTAL